MPKFDQPKRFRAVGAYGFAGGFTLGMSKHFNILAHLEDGTFGVSTFSQNFPNVSVLQRGQWSSVPDCDILFGNPPCSAWSVMGSFTDGHKWAESKDWRKAKSDCSSTMFSIWEALRTKIWVMESVTQLATKGKEFVLSVVHKAAVEGYGTWLVYHDPKFMGIPQTRRRVFLIISSIELQLSPPIDEISVIGDCLKNVKPSSIIPIVDPDLYWWYEAKPGQDFIRAWEDSGSDPDLKPRHRTAHRLDPNTPIGTIHSDGHFGHPDEPRFISSSELAYLSGFPSTYKWSGGDAKTKAEIAKGVTPAAGEWLGRNLRDSLIINRPVVEPRMTIVNFMAKSPRRSCDEMVNNQTEYMIEEFTNAEV